MLVKNLDFPMDEEFSKNPNDMELEEQIIDEDDLKSV